MFLTSFYIKSTNFIPFQLTQPQSKFSNSFFIQYHRLTLLWGFARYYGFTPFHFIKFYVNVLSLNKCFYSILFYSIQFIWYYSTRKSHYTLYFCEFNSILFFSISLLLSKCEIRFCHDTQKAKIRENQYSRNIQNKKIRKNQFPRNTPKRHSRKLVSAKINIREN